MSLFNKILIANRGEIAVRVIRACKELGIKSASIYSDADKTALHARLSDEAYYIGKPASADSYLNKDKIISLAKKINADAIHPGYGFFSENADFIEELEKANIAFIGPSSASVKMMGSKTAARQLMAEHNVPIVPGTTEAIKNILDGKKAASEIGYPVLLKASAGGGGKGMRKISSDEDFESAFEATQREALKAFADSSIYIEKFIENPKHIEVQIIADKQGNYAHLFERECSIQRRHQKIIEESPSSFVDEETRKKITTAAVNAAKACGYFNAGTIEFLMDSEKKFYFLEMNTRLQVEHPVTEMITGIDLVKEQIAVAAGKKLSFKQPDIKINGHAVECRIYAEDPENNFLPSTGKIYEYKPPDGPGVRVDSGFDRGSEISIYYDPLIAKLVCWSSDRLSALKRMQRALDEFKISGFINNIAFLNMIIKDDDFVSGRFDINYLEKKTFTNSTGDNDEILKAAAAFSAIIKEQSRGKRGGSINDSGSANNWRKLLYE
jgi:acetyl-CoA carboxylase biotin carboxylase subunit